MAKPDFLKFLFETSQEETDAEAILEELKQVEDLKVAAKPLVAALKELGVMTDVGLVYAEEGVAVEAATPDEYRNLLEKLHGADAMNKLAEMGWVAVPSGDHNGQDGNPSLRVYFLQINKPTSDAQDNAHDVPDLDALIGKAREMDDQPPADQAADRKKKENSANLKEGMLVEKTYAAWRAAVKKEKPDATFDGDKDICCAPGVGEWDGEEGILYSRERKSAKKEKAAESAEELAKHMLEWDEDSEDSTVCPVCGGNGVPLGALGGVRHFRCRQCGSDFEQ